jgi:hypothetical protein
LGGLLTETFGLDFQDERMVVEAIDSSNGHGWLHKDIVLGTEGMVACNHATFEFITVGNQFKQN